MWVREYPSSTREYASRVSLIQNSMWSCQHGLVATSGGAGTASPTAGKELTGGRAQVAPAQGTVQETGPRDVQMTYMYGSETEKGPVPVTVFNVLAVGLHDRVAEYTRLHNAASPIANEEQSGALKTLQKCQRVSERP